MRLGTDVDDDDVFMRRVADRQAEMDESSSQPTRKEEVSRPDESNRRDHAVHVQGDKATVRNRARDGSTSGYDPPDKTDPNM